MKKIFYILIVLSLMLINLSLSAVAQSPDWQWAKSTGGIATDRGTCITTDAKGNIYVAGTFNSVSLAFGTDTVYHHTRGAEHKYDTDIFLVKFNTKGDVIWALSAGGTGEDNCKDIAVDSTGNLYMTGSFWSLSLPLGDTTLKSTFPNGTAFTAKFNPNGKILWGVISNVAGQSIGMNIIVDTVGNSYSTGFFSGQMFIGDSIIKSKGVFDTFLVKYSPEGQLEWATPVGGSESEFPSALGRDPSGFIYMTGRYNSPTVIFDSLRIKKPGFPELQQYDVFIAKYDSSGAIVWVKTIGGTGDDECKDITFDPTGNFYIIGGFEDDSLTIGSTTMTRVGGNSSVDVFFAKFDSDGNLLWARDCEGGSQSYMHSLALDKAGNIYTIGYFNGTSIQFGSHLLFRIGNSSTNFIIKYNSEGRFDKGWTMAFKQTINPHIAMTADTKGDIYCTGFFENSSLSMGKDELINKGSQDIFVAKLQAMPVDIHTEVVHSVIQVVTSPGSHSINISGDDVLGSTISVYTLRGELMVRSIINGIPSRYMNDWFTPGIYVYQIQKGNSIIKSGTLNIE